MTFGEAHSRHVGLAPVDCLLRGKSADRTSQSRQPSVAPQRSFEPAEADLKTFTGNDEGPRSMRANAVYPHSARAVVGCGRCFGHFSSRSWVKNFHCSMMFLLSVVLLLGSGTEPATAQSLQCYNDESACRKACLDAKESPNSGRDCTLACSFSDSRTGGSCFMRFFPPTTASAPVRRLNPRLYEQLYAACDDRECKPAFGEKTSSCYLAYKNSKPDLRECTGRAFRESIQCSKHCTENAMKGAVISVPNL